MSRLTQYLRGRRWAKQAVSMGKVVDDIYPPLVASDERALLTSELRSAKSYLEFGTGGSTMMALNLGVSRIVTADSDPAWSKRIAARAAEVVPTKPVEFVFCDIGPIGLHGVPTTREFIDRWPNYVTKPWERFVERNERPDLIFIDGRFRAACAIYSLLLWQLDRAPWRKPPRIAIHDFVRLEYQCILDFVDVIAKASTLAIVTPKKRMPAAAALRDLMSRQFETI